MNLSEIFARNLRVRMATLDCKTSDLFRLTGISKTTLMALQSGNNKGIQFTTVEKLAVALKCNPWQLFDEDMNWTAYKWANKYQGVNKNE